MEHIRKLDKNRMRQNNVRLIFETIYRVRGVTRGQLASRTKMSAMNVGRIVDDLMEHGFVEERDGSEPGAPGRPAKRLYLCRNNILNLGVSLDVWGVFVGLVDPYGRIVAETHHPFEGPLPPPEETLRLVADVIGRFCAEQNVPPGLCGVVMPGLLDPEKGHLRLSSQLGWRDLPVVDMLREYTGLPGILLENDVKGRAQAEARCGAAKGYNTSVTMTIGSGIGAGIVIDGKIYRGKDNMAGEIGHIAISTHYKLCECGQVGCLQATVTEAALLQEARTIAPGIDMEGIASAYADGVLWARRLLDLACGSILTTINLLANTFASEAIVLCGSFIDKYPVFRALIREAYERQQPGFLNTNFDLVFSEFGPDGNTIGAATVAFNHRVRKLISNPAIAS